MGNRVLAIQQAQAFAVEITVTSSAIPNNAQTGGAITAAAVGDVLVDDIILETDSTGLAGPTNINFTTNNAKGLTGASNPVVAQAVSGLGANKTISCKAEATTKHFPFVIED